MLTLAIILTTASIATYGLIVIARGFKFERAYRRMREEAAWGDVAFVCEEMRAATRVTGGAGCSGQRPFAQNSAIARHGGGL